MLSTLLALFLASPGDRARLLTDFVNTDLGWRAVNDNVMGGRSAGEFKVAAGQLHFSGSLNTDGGGFASVRSASRPLGLAGTDGVRLRVRGDGRRYTVLLRMRGAEVDGREPSFQAPLDTQAGQWMTADLPFSAFKPFWRGRRLSGPTLDVAAIDGLGLMINDKRDGPFSLTVERIEAYGPPVKLASLRWARRPLLVFAPTEKDPRLAQQLAAVEATRPAFQDRDMALVIVVGDRATIDGAPADAAALRDRFGVAPGDFAVRLVGKDGGVKRSADAPVDPATIYALIDSMPMRQSEMRR